VQEEASAPAARPGASAALDAIGEAIELTRQRLFPVRFETWLTLGFVAFLDQCGRTSGGFSIPGNLGGDGAGSRRTEALVSPLLARAEWPPADWGWVAGVALGILVAILLVVALVLWLNSRGVFLYLDGVVRGRAEVTRPWREHAARADSYFLWSLGLALATLAVIALLVALAIPLVLALRRDGFGVGPVVGLVALAGGLVGLILLASLLSLLLRDFVAPLQWRLGLSCGQALPLGLRLVAEQPLTFLVYVLVKLAFALLAGLLAVLVGCLTCCLGFLPVVSQTLLQPLYYFERAWSLLLLRRLGHDVFAVAREPA
jgi:hypothetical protein